MERTYVMTKPDTYTRHLIGEIITRFEKKGYTIVEMKMFTLTKEQLSEHYKHLSDRPFFNDLIQSMMVAPVVGMILEGPEVVRGAKILIGPTQWYDALPGTIRGDYASVTQQNLVHCSDSVENAEIEIKRFFN